MTFLLKKLSSQQNMSYCEIRIFIILKNNIDLHGEPLEYIDKEGNPVAVVFPCVPTDVPMGQ